MKKILLVLNLLMLSSLCLANPRFNYRAMKDEIMACKKSPFGCSQEQELEIARFNGILMSPHDLDEYLVKDKKSIFVPLELTNGELLTLAAATSLGIVAFKNDQEIMDTVQANRTKVTDKVSSVGNFLGSTPGSMAIAAGSYFLGVYYKDNRLMKAGIFIVNSSIATGIVVGAVKLAAGRVRPHADRGPYNFGEFGNKSFYSGHTTQIFTVATVISELYKKDYPIVPYVAYGVAALAGYSRVNSKAHWASDVIIGAIAGHLITKLAMNAMSGNREGRGVFEIYPGVDPLTGKFMIYFDYRGKEAQAPMKCSKMPEGSLKIEACLAEGFARAKK